MDDIELPVMSFDNNDVITEATIREKQEEWMNQLQQVQAEYQKLERHIATLEGAIQACQVFIDINTNKN